MGGWLSFIIEGQNFTYGCECLNDKIKNLILYFNICNMGASDFVLNLRIQGYIRTYVCMYQVCNSQLLKLQICLACTVELQLLKRTFIIEHCKMHTNVKHYNWSHYVGDTMCVPGWFLEITFLRETCGCIPEMKLL